MSNKPDNATYTPRTWHSIDKAARSWVRPLPGPMYAGAVTFRLVNKSGDVLQTLLVPAGDRVPAEDGDE